MPKRRIYISLVIFVFIIVMGTCGFKLLYPNRPILDALYMTVITITTVGYGEVFERTPLGEIFSIILILSGIIAITFIVQSLIHMAIVGELQQFIGRRKMEKEASKLRDHYIICGFGRIGRIVCNELRRKKTRFVVIEKDEKNCEEVQNAQYVGLLGDATKDEILMKANVKDAKCMVALANSDSENVFITLSARQLNPDLFIVARVQESGAEDKLLRAGANKAILPYRIGAMQIAQTALKPNVIDLVEIVTRTTSVEYQIEELRVKKGSSIINKTLKELELNKILRVIIIGIKRADQMIFNPAADMKINANDILISLGNTEQLRKLEEMLM